MAAKNRERFNELYRNYGRLVRNFLFRLGARSQLDDLTQETFIRAWKNVDHLREPKAAKAWLLKIALHQFYDWCRTNREKFIELDDDFFECLHETGAERFESHEAAHEILKGLTVHQRTVCLLFYVEDFSIAEIAEVLQIPEGTVKTRLMKAREQMKVALAEKV